MALKRVTTEISGAVFSLPYYVARDEGYFREEGLEVDFVRAEPRQWALEDDHRLVDSIGGHVVFERGQAAMYRACEWGQIRRSYDSTCEGRIISKRAAAASQAIFVRPNSPCTHPQDLRNLAIAVNFHAGSHYIALQMLEGFLRREHIRVIHLGGPRQRFQALMDGTVAAATLMEPWIAVAEKLGCKLICEAHYVGAEIASPDMDPETYEAIARAIRKAVEKLNQDPQRFLHYLIAEVPASISDLRPEDFRLSRLRYVEPAPYPPEEFQETYEWMLSWGLIAPDASFEQLVDNRIGLAAR